MIIIASHAVFNKDGSPVHGTGSEIETYLQKKKEQYVFIKHPLYKGNNTRSETFDGKDVKVKKIGFSNVPFFVHRLQDQIITFLTLRKLKEKAKVFIGIDPFNGFLAVRAKRFGFVESSVFYTADYAHLRFENKLLNDIYHWFDRFCIKNADFVWNVSIKIYKLRKKQGVEEKRNIYLPNTPEFGKTKRLPLSKINKKDLVIVSNLTSSINYSLIFKVIDKLKNKHKNIKLLIIGEGSYKNSLNKMIKDLYLEKYILLLGKKPHHEVLEILSKSGVGLAFYTNTNSWTKFGDSMKVREYLACGLPVVMNDIVSTSQDIKKHRAGIVITSDSERQLYNAIDKLLSNKKFYLKTRKNAVNLAKEYNFTKIFASALNKI